MAVFSVGSSSSKMPGSKREETRQDLALSDKFKRRVAKPTFVCTDPEAVIHLFAEDAFVRDASSSSGGVLSLTKESPR